MNPLISRIGQNNQSNSIGDIMRALKTRNSDDVAKTLCNINPSFRQFYNANRGKTIQQICSENGISEDMLKQFLR